MSEEDMNQSTTAMDTAQAAPASAPSDNSSPISSTSKGPSSAPANGDDRPTGPGIPGPRSSRQIPAKSAAPLKTPIPETNEPAPAQPPAVGLTIDEVQKALNIKSAEDLKRFQNREQLFGRQTNELGQMRQKVAAFEKQQALAKQQADAQKLKPWAKTHPEHNRWQGLHSKVQDNNKRVAQLAEMAKGLPPEHQENWINEQTQRIRGELLPEETQQWNDFVDHKKSEDLRWHTDREGVLSEHFDRMFEQRMQQREAEMQAQKDVEKDLESPEIKQFMADPNNQAEFDTALTGMSQDPWSYATHLVKMKQQNEALWKELEHLKSQNGEVTNRLQLQQVQAGIKENRAKAAITRDVRPAKGDPFMLARKEAQEKGIDTLPTNPAWRNLLQKHTAANANS
jgi:hypothetical protein